MANLSAAISRVSPATDVSDAQMDRLVRLVYQRTGIFISRDRKSLLSKRIARRLAALCIDCYDDYLRRLASIGDDHPEWDAFIEAVATHETYLYRDPRQWTWFQTEFLPAAAAERSARRRPSLRIWSAAASSGEEAYTIAACIAAAAPRFADWSITILGTDIGLTTLARARAAAYGMRAMRNVPDDVRRRFFVKSHAGNVWHPTDELRALVRFESHNLLEPLDHPPFDIIFLKNVLIYFDRSSKAAALAHVRAAMADGAWLVTSAAEGIYDLARGLVPIEPWLYRRPPASERRR